MYSFTIFGNLLSQQLELASGLHGKATVWLSEIISLVTSVDNNGTLFPYSASTSLYSAKACRNRAASHHLDCHRFSSFDFVLRRVTFVAYVSQGSHGCVSRWSTMSRWAEYDFNYIGGFFHRRY